MSCAVQGYMQLETLQTGMAHPAARHSSDDCHTPPCAASMWLLAETGPYFYKHAFSGLACQFEVPILVCCAVLVLIRPSYEPEARQYACTDLSQIVERMDDLTLNPEAREFIPSSPGVAMHQPHHLTLPPPHQMVSVQHGPPGVSTRIPRRCSHLPDARLMSLCAVPGSQASVAAGAD